MPGTRVTVRDAEAGGIPNGSLSPWTTSTGTVTASSSGSASARGAPGRVQREREAQDADRAGRGRGAAGDPGAGRAAADDERQPAQLAAAQLLDDRGPGRVELARRTPGERRPATR